MNFIILLIKGIMIGIGKIVPGVSGAMIAISLNVYEKSINLISHFLSFKKEKINFLLPLGIGILISIILFSKIILKLLAVFYLPTMLLFIGLIIGGMKKIRQQMGNINLWKLLSLLLIIILTIFISKVENINSQQYTFTNNVLVGFVEALTMIIPGISGTAVLMYLGYYNFIMTAFSNINIIVLLQFGLGLIVGIISITKIANFFLVNYKQKVYTIIYGFSVSSIILMLSLTFTKNYQLIEVVISLLLLILGYFITNLIEK